MTVTYEIANDITYPHLKIYRRIVDGVLGGYRVNTDDGYVMYDTVDDFRELDEETGKKKPVIYFITQALLPINFDFADFSYVAVQKNTADENYIFGLPTHDETI